MELPISYEKYRIFLLLFVKLVNHSDYYSPCLRIIRSQLPTITSISLVAYFLFPRPPDKENTSKIF